MADLDEVRRRAEALILEHLPSASDGRAWTFAFDRAVRRAGACHFRHRRITVSRHHALRGDPDTIEQIVLHEIAHALAGPNAGHDRSWRRIARSIGYRGERTHSGTDVVRDLAPWVGYCAAGHEHHRFRRPSRALSCGRCASTFDPAHRIRWQRRPPPQSSLGNSGSAPH